MSDFDMEERARSKPEEIANSFKMQWDSPAFDGKTLLLVEYEADKKCYYKLFNQKKVEIRTTTGCNSMKRLFDAIQPHGIPNFAIQDSDFARVCGRIPEEPNYFVTDWHDHEMMCLHDGEVMKALFSNLAIEYDEVLVNKAFEDLKVLSYFKWYNYHHHLNVNFKGYKPRGKSKEELGSFNAIYDVVKTQSPCCSVTITEADVASFVSSQTPKDFFEITNGHDFLDVLSQSIEEKHQIHGLNREKLQPIIYACFTFERFERTQLYQEIRSWAAENACNLFAA